MRKTMNLRALMSRQPVNEDVNLGDTVEVKQDGEKREGVVKVADGPGDTTGVLIDGELEMVHTEDVSRKIEDDSEEVCEDDEQIDDDDDADAEQITEGVLGMTIMPSLERMRQLAGIRVEAFDFASKDDEEKEETETAEETVDCETADCSAPEDCEDKSDCDEATPEDKEAIVVAVEPADAPTSDPVEEPVAPEVAANHPASAGEVTMMSAQVDPDPMPDAEEAPNATPTQACFDAVAQIEQELPNIPVKDFAEVRKRMQAVLNSLMEGTEGRRRKI